MNRLIEDLLDIARIEAGGFELERKPLSAEKLLADVAEGARPLASAASIASPPRAAAPIAMLPPLDVNFSALPTRFSRIRSSRSRSAKIWQP